MTAKTIYCEEDGIALRIAFNPDGSLVLSIGDPDNDQSRQVLLRAKKQVELIDFLRSKGER